MVWEFGKMEKILEVDVMAKLTDEQIWEILDKADEARDKGDFEGQYRLLKQIPISPWLAKAGKEVWGKEFLLEGDYNLSEAEEAYGKDWLSR
jgi:hypothetical protein